MSGFPRDLTPRERELLDFIIQASDDSHRLRRLFAHTKAIGGCPCGCETIKLTIDASAVPDDWVEDRWCVLGQAYASVGGLRNSLEVLLIATRNDADLEFVWGDPALTGSPLPPVS